MKTKHNLFMLLLALLLALTPALSPAKTVHAATCTVTSAADSGEGSLRSLLGDTTCDTIGFASDISIHLTSPLWVDSGRTITIDGTVHTVNLTDDAFRRVITVASGADATLQNITISQGSDIGYFVEAEGSMSESSMIPNFGTLEINNCTIIGNPAMPANMVGSAIMNRGTLRVSRSTLTGHSALGGGAIYNDGYMSDGLANTTVTDSTFTGNISWVQGAGNVWTGIFGGGGAIANFSGSLTVTGSTFKQNTAFYAGGAIASVGPFIATNNTFANNTATMYGGAIFTYMGELTNNTFVGNGATNGALWFYDGGFPLTLKNNLMVKDSMSSNCSYDAGEGEPGGIAGSNNLADDDSCATPLFTGITTVENLSTQVGALSDNGGPTQTIPLLSGSAAIDAGAVCPATDQRGVVRPQGAACDAGAYEYEPPSDYSISGTVYEDVNANGARDADETGAEGARVILDLGFTDLTTDAAADGSYQFTLPAANIPAGFSVSVYVEPSSGVKITQTPALDIPLTGNLTGMDIGLHQIALISTPARFPDGMLGVFYNQTLALGDGDAPYTFIPTTSWSVPAGLIYTFDPQAGTITLTGTPSEAGTFHTHIDITEANGAFGQIWEDFTIYPPMQFSPDSLPDGSLGVAYNQTITVSGGVAPYNFKDHGSEEWLPSDLTIDTSSGDIVIAGTPTEAGHAVLDVYVYDQTGSYIEIQPAFWIKTDPALTLTSSLNPSLQGQEVTFSLASTATVAKWPAPWGQVTFKADGAAISGCDGLWMGYDPNMEQLAPNPVTCTTSALTAGSHTITAALTILFGPYNSATATLTGGQTVNANAPLYQSAGFTAPLDLGDVLNTAKAGQMIPLKWRLLDSTGVPVTNIDPASVNLTVNVYTCPAGVPVDTIETYTTGTSTLQNLGDGYYQLNWKTDKAWANSCKQLTLKIGTWTGDGLNALFQFKK